jgi:hypothetical protein
VAQETRLHMGVLIEDVKGHIKLVAEGHMGLRELLMAQREEFQRSNRCGQSPSVIHTLD